MKNKLSLIQISNAVSAQRELNAHPSTSIKCLCMPDMSKHVHEPIFEANRW